MKIVKTISTIGLQKYTTPSQEHYLRLSNQISVLLSLLMLCLSWIKWLQVEWVIPVQIGIASLFWLVPLLNYWGYTRISRVVLIAIIVMPIIVMSVVENLHHENPYGELSYVVSLHLLLIYSLFPFILFSSEEKPYLLSGFLIPFVLLLSFNSIHKGFSADIPQIGLWFSNYSILNYIVAFTYLILSISICFLKQGYELSQKKNKALISQLSNHQNEIFITSKSNKELARQNSELEQFSYTISHNLKGSTANLRGLLNMMDIKNMNDQNMEIVRLLRLTVATLNSTIKDLSNLIDIRNNTMQVYQKIFLKEEVSYITTLLRKSIEDSSITIKTDFNKAEYMYSIRPMLVSILYNLISNGIKYRSKTTDSEVRITSEKKENKIFIYVEDNGLGIDLDKNKDTLFGIYKRFSDTPVEGKGLGLFLVKIQVGLLKGDISVESKLGAGTCFTISLPIPNTIDKQVILENSIGKLYFNAPLNSLELYWKQNVCPEDTMKIMRKMVVFTEKHPVLNWMVNIEPSAHQSSQLSTVYEVMDQLKFKKTGLEKVAVTGIKEKINGHNAMTSDDLRKRFPNISIQHFSTDTEAKMYLIKKNSNTSVDQPLELA